jgi:hypothetical protein
LNVGVTSHDEVGVRLISKNIVLFFLAPLLLSAQGAETQPAADPATVVVPAPEKPDGETPLPGDPGSTLDKRIFGVLPNYRTADGTLPFRPITTKQKFTIATKDTFDYPSYFLAALFSGISQANNTNPSFGQGLEGYAKRYGSAVVDQDLGNFMTEAIWPSLLRQDPRYFRKVNGSFKERFWYASTRTIVTRTDKGHWAFNASEFVGNGTVAAIGNLYYTDARGFGPTMQRMFTQIGTDTISNLMKEFWPDIKRAWLHKHDSKIIN